MRILIFVLLSFLAKDTFAEERIFERLDHFLAASERSAELFHVFSETFQLPVAWPHESYDGFASGGVSVGGSILELISYPEYEGRTKFTAIAYLPVNHIPTVREQLERNHVVLGANDPYIDSEDGEEHVLWETFNIVNLSSATLSVFVCDYKYRDFVAANRDGARAELKDKNGGPLGIVGLAEIQIGTSDISAKSEEWAKLNLQRSSENRFSADDGAQIKLVNSSNDEIQGITLKVRSLVQAADWLEDQDLLGASSAEFIQIAPAAIQGLTILLIE